MSDDLLQNLQETDSWMRLRRRVIRTLSAEAEKGDLEAAELLAFINAKWSAHSAPRQLELIEMKHTLRLTIGKLRDVIKFVEGDT